jgi:hypothetical protein
MYCTCNSSASTFEAFEPVLSTTTHIDEYNLTCWRIRPSERLQWKERQPFNEDADTVSLLRVRDISKSPTSDKDRQTRRVCHLAIAGGSVKMQKNIKSGKQVGSGKKQWTMPRERADVSLASSTPSTWWHSVSMSRHAAFFSSLLNCH